MVNFLKVFPMYKGLSRYATLLSMAISLETITFVVVEPHHPGNIGSICRACKNMGISHITLVNPVDYMVEETFKLGWASEDVIRSIRKVSTLEEAIEGMHLVIGTTQRQRGSHPPIVAPREVGITLASMAQAGLKVAILFGRENNGLTNEELAQCQWISRIPSKSDHPALNLSQAVMLYAYELYLASAEKAPIYEWNLAKASEVDLLFRHLEETMSVLPIDMRKGPEEFVNLFRRVLNRTQLEERDVRLFHKLCQLIERKK